MVSTRNKNQSNRRFFSQLDNFGQDIIIGNTASEKQENVKNNEGTSDREFTVGTSDNKLWTNENKVTVKILKR